MIKGKTKSGFEYKVNENKLKDARLLRSFARAQKNEDGFGNIEIMVQLIGENQYDAICDHVEKNGIANIDDVMVEVQEILEAVAKNENSKN